jgi:hypothetical protein
MVPLLSDRFTRVFREEHREIRDLLLDLVEAFRGRDSARLPGLISQIAARTGPHFRYEEEAMYPSLVDLFGAEYIDKLLADHDLAIATARRLAALASRDSLTDDEVDEGVRGARRILPHVSDCDGLSIMVERLPPARIQAIFDARSRARADNLDLLHWAAEVRDRPS